MCREVIRENIISNFGILCSRERERRETIATPRETKALCGISVFAVYSKKGSGPDTSVNDRAIVSGKIKLAVHCG